MRLVTLLFAIFAFLLFAPSADAAPVKVPAKPAGQQQSPGKPTPSGKSSQKQHAKKEEETAEDDEEPRDDEDEDKELSSEEAPADDEEPKDDEDEDEETETKEKKSASSGREGYFSGLWSGVRGKRNEKLEALQKENDGLKAEVKKLRKENKEQARQLAHFDKNWPAIEAALTQGDADAPALQTDLGKKVATATMKTTAQQMHKTGHEAKKLPGPKADAPDTGKQRAAGEPVPMPTLAEAARQYWGSIEAPWTQSGNPS